MGVERSGAEECLDGAAFVHGLVALSDALDQGRIGSVLDPDVVRSVHHDSAHGREFLFLGG
jgi:hypothetical protein